MTLLRSNRHLAALKYGLVWRKPKFLLRMARFYARSFVLPGEQPLRYVDFAINRECNLACAHCFEKGLAPDGESLTIEDYRRIAAECLDLGAIHLSLQGGEPTLHPQLREIVAALQPWRCLVSFTTNGTTITRTRAKLWRSWGVDQLNVSVDSANPAEHDVFRGIRGAWARTMAGIRDAQKEGLQVQINTTVSKASLNAPGFVNLIRWCIENRILTNLVLAAPAGNWTGAEDQLLDGEDMRKIRKLIESTPWVRHDSDSIQLGRGCPAMKEAIYVSRTGHLMACPFMHASFGSLKTHSVHELRRIALQYPFLATHANKCLVAEDREFITRYMRKIGRHHNLPAPHREIFGEPE